MLAGTGSVAFRVALGHFGPATDRQVFGLAIDVERVVGPAKRRLPTRIARVLIVPWDYGADCQPTPYARSVRWVSEGTRGMFSATLRPKAEWVGGVPTLDAFTPELDPYPSGQMQQAVRRRAGAPCRRNIPLHAHDRWPCSSDDLRAYGGDATRRVVTPHAALE